MSFEEFELSVLVRVAEAGACSAGRSRYVVVVEDDVLIERLDPSFDPLTAWRTFPRPMPRSSRPAPWPTTPTGPGASETWSLSAFDLDIFVGCEDLSHNSEDLVSHDGTTGGRRIAWPDGWPLRAHHCDRKVAAGSMHNTQDTLVEQAPLDHLHRDAR